MRNLGAIRKSSAYVLDQPERAQRFLASYLRRNPRDEDAVLMMATCLYNLGRETDLAGLPLPDWCPDERVVATVAALKARAFLRDGDPGEAIRMVRLALEDPTPGSLFSRTPNSEAWCRARFSNPKDREGGDAYA